MTSQKLDLGNVTQQTHHVTQQIISIRLEPLHATKGIQKVRRLNWYTLCSEKNTHSHVLLYLCGKWLNLHKIFRECLLGNKYSKNGKVRYSLLPVTSC